MEVKKEFIGIIKANEGLIYKLVKVYSNNKEDEQDLYQEIIYQLWNSFPSFRKEAKITTWMYRIALNTSISFLNKEKRKATLVTIDEGLLNKPAMNDPDKEERIEMLYARIKELSSIEKAIILLYLEGKSYDEIAVLTGFSATNVGTRLGRIKQKMIAQIKK